MAVLAYGPRTLNSLLPKAELRAIPSRDFHQPRDCDVPRHPREQQNPPFAALPPYHAWNHIYPYHDTMSLSYESRASFMPESNYPQMQMLQDHQEQEDLHQDQHPRYPSPPPPLSENPYHPPHLAATPDDGMEVPTLPPSHESEAPTSPGRSKPIPKPDREVTKGPNGRFVCTYENCTEEIRDFGRKVGRPILNLRVLSANR